MPHALNTPRSRVQPKKVVESKYAAKDAAYNQRAAAAAQIDPNDAGAAARAQRDAEMGDLAAELGGGPQIDPLAPKTKAEFDKYAADILSLIHI